MVYEFVSRPVRVTLRLRSCRSYLFCSRISRFHDLNKFLMPFFFFNHCAVVFGTRFCKYCKYDLTILLLNWNYTKNSISRDGFFVFFF